MANDYLDYFTINGVDVYIQDCGRDQPNGIPVLDPQGKLPTKYIPDNYANKLLVSPKDPYKDDFVTWVGKLVSQEFKNKGKPWEQGTGANTNVSMQYLVYANGLWVCGSQERGMWWSEDGKSWTQGTGDNTAYTMQSLVYANGLWVCCSSSHGMWWSEDGKNWTQGTGANTTYRMQYLGYANGLWVCGSKSHGIWWSGVPVYLPELS